MTTAGYKLIAGVFILLSTSFLFYVLFEDYRLSAYSDTKTNNTITSNNLNTSSESKSAGLISIYDAGNDKITTDEPGSNSEDGAIAGGIVFLLILAIIYILKKKKSKE